MLSAQHVPRKDQRSIRDYVREVLLPRRLGPWWHADIVLHVNPTGAFALGGPAADCGVTGRNNTVETFGTGDSDAAQRLVSGFDFRPRAIIERLDLRRPIYGQTTNYGHFGRPGLPWET